MFLIATVSCMEYSVLQICFDWHSWTNRSVHMVCIWNHHNRSTGMWLSLLVGFIVTYKYLHCLLWRIKRYKVSFLGLFVSLCGYLCDGHGSKCKSGHLYVQHALRLQVSVSHLFLYCLFMHYVGNINCTKHSHVVWKVQSTVCFCTS